MATWSSFLGIVLLALPALTLCACPVEFTQYGNDCFKLFWHVSLKQPEAEAMCQEMGGHLARIEDYAKNKFMEGLLYTSHSGYHREFWTAGFELMKEDEWVWFPDETPMTFTDWAPGEPNDWHGAEDCLVVFLDTITRVIMWNDESCQRNLNFMCQVPMDVAS